MAARRRTIALCAALLLTAAAPAYAQQMTYPGVYVQEVSVRLPGGESATGRISLVRARDGRTALAPNTRRTLVNRAAIEIPAGEVQRLLQRASREGTRFELTARARGEDGQYHTITLRDAIVSSYQTGGRGPASATITSGQTTLPAVACNPAICTGPSDDFLFMYDCLMNGHTYAPGVGGQQSVCFLNNE